MRQSRATRGGARPTVVLFSAALVLAAVLGTAPAGAVEGPGWGACLECHDDPDLTLTTNAGEEMPLTVREAALGGSAHRSLGCRECHPGIMLDEHPEGAEVESVASYRESTSMACRRCHQTLRAGAVAHHAVLQAANDGLSCVGCHGAHEVRSVRAWKAALDESEYCLSCHGRGVTLRKEGRGSIALDIDAGRLAESVHPDHACTDCHESFSKTEHPVAEPGAGSLHTLASNRVCAGCHEDKLAQAEGGIHFALLASGVGEAPGCTDCHSAHEVAPKERLASIAGVPCRRCHAEVFAAYTGSMHGMARGVDGHLEAPLCSDCHRAHDVRGTESPDRIREACLGCHSDGPAAHAAWLPNAALHLEAVSCAACHAPEARRMVALRIVDAGSGRTLAEREVTSLLGREAAEALDPAGDGIGGLELWSFLRSVDRRRANAPVLVAGRLELVRGVDAHRLASRGSAVRRCERCHSSGSSFFATVAVKLADDEGRPLRYEAESGLLASPASIVPIRSFYALGGTRVVVLDAMLVLAFLGGLAVPAAHGTARVLARRRAQKGGRP